MVTKIPLKKKKINLKACNLAKAIPGHHSTQHSKLRLV